MTTTDDWNQVEKIHNALDPRLAASADLHGWADKVNDAGGDLSGILLAARASDCATGSNASQRQDTRHTPDAPLQKPLREGGKRGGEGDGPSGRVTRDAVSNKVTFSGTAKDFISFTLANDAVPFKHGKTLGARKVDFSANNSPSLGASHGLKP